MSVPFGAGACRTGCRHADPKAFRAELSDIRGQRGKYLYLWQGEALQPGDGCQGCQRTGTAGHV